MVVVRRSPFSTFPAAAAGTAEIIDGSLSSRRFISGLRGFLHGYPHGYPRFALGIDASSLVGTSVVMIWVTRKQVYLEATSRNTSMALEPSLSYRSDKLRWYPSALQNRGNRGCAGRGGVFVFAL